jgi:hypothetical protein
VPRPVLIRYRKKDSCPFVGAGESADLALKVAKKPDQYNEGNRNAEQQQ